MLKRALARLANTRIGFFIIRTLLRPEGIFICYPVQQRFADHFCSRERQRRIPWNPCVVGVIRQGSTTTLLCVISSSEAEFTKPENSAALARLHFAAENLRNRTRAIHVSYAGILPTVLRSHRLLRTSTEAEVTCRAVCQAIAKIARSGTGLPHRIAVLGGRGYIGRKLIAALREDEELTARLGGHAISLDKGDAIPQDAPLLLVNCSLPGVIDTMAELIPSGSIVLNEVYPAPASQTVSALDARGIAVFHVAGVCGRAWPPFPDEYAAAIPCCAAVGQSKLGVVVHRLQPE